MIKIDLEILKKLVEIPPKFEKNKETIREGIPLDILTKVKVRDKFKCRICGYDNNIRVHHIIPNGQSIEENLIVICANCHKYIHYLLWREGKWKYIPPFK